MIESYILIICDEPTTSRVWGLLLTDLHCRPVNTNSLSRAISAIEETAPDLMVIDAKSRDVNAVEICTELRDHVAAPMLLLPPINNESHTLEAYQAGVDECVIKPISPALYQFQPLELLAHL